MCACNLQERCSAREIQTLLSPKRKGSLQRAVQKLLALLMFALDVLFLPKLSYSPHQDLYLYADLFPLMLPVQDLTPFTSKSIRTEHDW